MRQSHKPTSKTQTRNWDGSAQESANRTTDAGAAPGPRRGLAAPHTDHYPLLVLLAHSPTLSPTIGLLTEPTTQALEGEGPLDPTPRTALPTPLAVNVLTDPVTKEVPRTSRSGVVNAGA